MRKNNAEGRLHYTLDYKVRNICKIYVKYMCIPLVYGWKKYF